MTRYSRLVLGATLALVVVAAALAWGFSLSGRKGASAHMSDIPMRANLPALSSSVWSDTSPPTPTPPIIPIGTTSVTVAPSATQTPAIVPTATATPAPAINNGKPCLQLAATACGRNGSQTINPQTDNIISVSGDNWDPATTVTVYLVKARNGIGTCALTSSVSKSTSMPDKSGTVRTKLTLPANASDGDTYRVCAQQGKVAPAPAAILLISVSRPSASPFDVYSAAALLLVVISALAGAPELARMLSRIGGQPGA